LEIEGLLDFPFILKIQIKAGYFQLKICFAHKTNDYSEVELRYIKCLQKEFEDAWFYCINYIDESNLKASEGLDLFVQKFEHNFKAYRDGFKLSCKEY